MQRAMLIFVFIFGFTGMLALPVMAQDAPERNLTAGCVEAYDADVNYFPEQVVFEVAGNVSVEYFNNYKLIEVDNNGETFTSVLVQCGTPAPDAADFPQDAVFVDVPVEGVVALSTTYLPHLVGLGKADTIVGLDNLDFASAPAVRERIDAEAITQVSPGFELNIEIVLDLAPDIVITDGFDPARLAQLAEVGVDVALNTEYNEANPLGRAEWIKHTALFFNEEAAANAEFEDIVSDYNALVDLAADVPDDERPRVLWNAPFQGTWFVPGLETFPAQLIEDAGAIVAVAESEGFAQATPLSVEAVYEQGLGAEFWVLNLFAVETIEDLVAQDERYADFAAVQMGNIWNNDLATNPTGGNNYFELGVTNPHLILADLIAIFHPELAPEGHEFTFYRALE